MDESSSSSSSSSSSPSSSSSSCHELDLPGFRFHPTEEELLNFYLRSIVSGNKFHGDIIAFLNIYKYQPAELPGLARMNGEREWYFFVPLNRKHGAGGRPNRTTEHGFWKATGSDRKILSLTDPRKMLGLKKTLVFYEGRAPRGRKTDWVMNEFRLPDHAHAAADACSLPQPQEIVLCKIYRKATPLKVLEQRAAMEETQEMINAYISPSPCMADSASSCDFEDVKLTGGEGWKFSFEWNQDTLWTLDNLTTFMPMC